jgi:hypothetical protein
MTTPSAPLDATTRRPHGLVVFSLVQVTIQLLRQHPLQLTTRYQSRAISHLETSNVRTTLGNHRPHIRGETLDAKPMTHRASRHL